VEQRTQLKLKEANLLEKGQVRVGSCAFISVTVTPFFTAALHAFGSPTPRFRFKKVLETFCSCEIILSTFSGICLADQHSSDQQLFPPSRGQMVQNDCLSIKGLRLKSMLQAIRLSNTGTWPLTRNSRTPLWSRVPQMASTMNSPDSVTTLGIAYFR
jgi:hypothetical protein